MKTKMNYLKKSLPVALAMMCACILFSTVAVGQTYYVVDWDDYTNATNVPYCSCDFIKCVPPVGETNITWFASGAPETYIGDTLVLENGFDGMVTCFYDSGQRALFLHPLTIPTSPLFEDLDLCTLTTTLDAGNVSSYGFTTYDWSNGASSQTIVAGPGTYTVNISNLCGSVNDDVVITYTNPNRPNLMDDQTFCFGETGTLNPHVVNPVSTLWSTGATTNELIVDESGTYSVYVLDDNGCDGRDTINVIVNTPVDMQMHDVSFDTVTNKNIQRWCVDPMQSEITHIRGEFKSLGVWTEIETVPYEQGYVIHWESMPQGIAYEYRLVPIGECGEGNPSEIHRSIWLSQFESELQWQNYFGFTPSYYIVFARMTNNTIIQMGMIDVCTGDGCLNHFPITANPDIVKYFVAFEHNCGAKDGIQYVFSNYYDPLSDVVTNEVADFSIFPNPATDQLSILINYDAFEVKIFNMLSENVLSETNVKTLDISTLAKGMYTLQLRTDDGLSIKKFIKQ